MSMPPQMGQAQSRLACSAWVLDFVQEKFHNPSAADFESILIKAGDSGAKEEHRVKEATVLALLCLPRNVVGKK